MTHTDAEYKVRIKPILQANFERKTKDDGTYTWEKLIPQRYTYYVANPRFIMTVKNENERNAGDVGYNVDTDNGLNITQARVNYSDLSYMDEQDLKVEMIRFECQLMFDFALAYFDEATEGATSFVFTLIEEARNLYEQSREKTIEVSNESNIFTELTRSAQREKAGYYARAIGVAPKSDNDIILSSAEDSYAELIMVLNDSNRRMRFDRFGEFDIVRRYKPFGNMEDVAQNQRFSKEEVLFEDQAPYFEIGGRAFEDASTDLYIFGGASQTVKFIPYYTGNYTFTVPAGLTLSVNGTECTLVNNKYSAKLQNDQAYYFKLTNTTKGYGPKSGL